MPLPSPKNKQSQDNFINSCMSNKTMKEEYPDTKQRVAVCFSQWKKSKKKKQMKGDETDPNWSEEQFILD